MNKYDEFLETDATGKFIKPESLQEVLKEFPSGQKARQVFEEIGDKVYLRDSLKKQIITE